MDIPKIRDLDLRSDEAKETVEQRKDLTREQRTVLNELWETLFENKEVIEYNTFGEIQEIIHSTTKKLEDSDPMVESTINKEVEAGIAEAREKLAAAIAK